MQPFKNQKTWIYYNERDSHSAGKNERRPSNAIIKASFHNLNNLDKRGCIAVFNVIHVKAENIKKGGKPRDHKNHV